MTIFELIPQIFTDYTLRNVVLGAVVLGIVSGALSAFAVLRKQSLLGDTMSHAALPGIVIAFMLTGERAPLPLMIGAAVAGWVGTLFMQLVTTQTRVKEDSVQGVILAVFFGIGLALLSWVTRQPDAGHAGLSHFLFGQAAATVAADVEAMVIVGMITLGLLALFWKEFKVVSFDPAYTASLGFPVSVLNILVTTLIVLTVVVGLQMVGVVLMSAMIVAPGVAARQWTNRLGRMVVLSACFGAMAGIVGTLLSATGEQMPTGPLIVLSISAIVLFSLFFAPERGLLWEWLESRRNARELQTTAVLERMYHMAMNHGDPYYPHTAVAIDAALPNRSARYTLNYLAKQGWVQQVGEGWALSSSGIQHLEELLHDYHLDEGYSLSLGSRVSFGEVE